MYKTTLLFLLLLSGVVAAQDVKVLNLKSNDVIYLPTTDRLYVSTPEGETNGNSLCVVDPYHGTIDTCYAIGGSPGALAVSDDEKYIYIGLTASPEIVRFDTDRQAVGQRFSLGSASPFYGDNFADDIAVVPGSPLAVAVSLMSQLTGPRHTGVAVFDDGVQRPLTTPVHTGSNSIAFDPATGLLYGFNNESSEFGLRKMAVTAEGVSVLSVTEGLFDKFGDEIEYADGRLYSHLGQLIDISGDVPVLAGQFRSDYSLYNAGLAAAPDSNVVYFLNSTYSPWLLLQTFDKNTYELVGQREFLNLGGYVWRMVSWGGEGKLAFITKDVLFEEHNHLVILRNCTSAIVEAPVLEQAPGACLGDTLALQAAPGEGPVFWSNGQVGPTALVTTTGEVYYQVADEQGCLGPPSNPVSPQFDYLPAPPYVLTPGSLALCQGGQVTLTTPSFPGPLGFLWSTGEAGPAIQVTEPGEYSVQALSLNGCRSEPSEPAVVYSLAEPAPPQPAITVDGETAFCDNMPSVLRAPGGYPGYLWNTGGLSAAITPYVSGLYSVQVQNEAGCLSFPSEPVNITIAYSPPIPDIFLSDNNFLFTTSPFDSLQWLLDGEPIPGATSQVLQAVETGIYSLQATWGGCTSVSNELYIVTSGVDEALARERPVLFPNPAQDRVYLRLNTSGASSGTAHIRSADGHLLSRQVLLAGQELQEIYLNGLPPGLYLVEAFDANGRRIAASRLVKQ